MAPQRATIRVPLQGGLGNQLFQLAAGIVAASRVQKQVEFSDFWLRNPEQDETPRTLAIGDLLGNHELIHERVPRSGHVTDRVVRRRVVERSSDDDALARLTARTGVLAGYLQRLTYVQEAWPELRRRLATSPDPMHRGLVTAAPADYGAIHYRLGDYVTNPQANRAHGVTSPGYFIDVIRDGLRSRGIRRWMVVSDDRERALELLRSEGLPSDVALDVPSADGEWGDLASLASASMCAISNSSFSWWAAFIGSSARDMRVVAPRPWFSAPGQPEPALFPDAWERRDRDILPREGGSDVSPGAIAR